MNKIEEKATQVIDVSIPVTLQKYVDRRLKASKNLECTKIIVLDDPLDIPSIELEDMTEDKCITIASQGEFFFLTMDYKNIIYTSVKEDGAKTLSKLRKIVGVHLIKTRLSTNEKFIYFKELIKDVFTKITEDRLFEMIWERNIALGWEQASLYLSCYGYKKYMDKFDPNLAKAFELTEAKGDDPEICTFQDLIETVYLSELEKQLSLIQVEDLFKEFFL